MQLSLLLGIYLLAPLENATRINAAYKPVEFMIWLGAGKKMLCLCLANSVVS